MTAVPPLQGSLRTVSLAGLLQLLSAEARSGRLAIESPTVTGFLWLERGLLTHAESSGASGSVDAEAAVDRLCGVDEGEFTFELGLSPARRTLTGSTDQLLMEAACRRDHADRASPGELPATARPQFAPVPAGASTPRFTTLQWRVLAAIDGQRSVEEIAAAVGMPVGPLSALLSELVAAGVLRLG